MAIKRLRRTRTMEITPRTEKEKEDRRRAEFLEKFIENNIKHKFVKQTGQLRCSLYVNRPKNTYEDIRKELLIFYPEIKNFLIKIEGLYDAERGDLNGTINKD